MYVHMTGQGELNNSPPSVARAGGHHFMSPPTGLIAELYLTAAQKQWQSRPLRLPFSLLLPSSKLSIKTYPEKSVAGELTFHRVDEHGLLVGYAW
jgi:hypothetical protein